MNILLAGSLSLLWGLINSLQLVTHFPLTNVIFPSNAKTYYGVMLEIASFDMIPTDFLEEVIDDEVGEADKSDDIFDASMTLSDSTIDAGYDSANAIMNSILNLIVFAVIVAIVLFILVLRVFCGRV